MAAPEPVPSKAPPRIVPPSRVLTRTFQAFWYRDFRRMWLGAFTSTTGTWMQTVAQSWVVLDLTNSPFYLGLTAFLSQLPILLFSLLAGVFADRIDRRKLLLASQYVQMHSAFVAAALIYFGWIQVWHLLVLAFVVGTAQSFGGPAYQALVPGLVHRKDVPNAIALNSIRFNLAGSVGPLLGGWTLASIGAALCFLLNGASFTAVIVSLYLIQATFIPPKATDSVIGGMRKGFSFVKKQEGLMQLSVLAFVSTFCGIPLLTLLPVFAKNIFETGVTGYSTMMSIWFAGAVVGGLLYAALSQMENRGRLTLYAQLVFALLLAAFGLSKNIALSYGVLFLMGISLIALFSSITSLVQLITTEEMRGRVMSIFMVAFRGGMPLGSLAAGYLASQFSPSFAVLSHSALLGSVALGFLLSRSRVKKL